MRAMFSLVALLIVALIVGLNVRNELRATKGLLPASGAPSANAASDAASAPFGGTSSPSVAQYQRELDRAMRDSAAHTASAAADADAATR
jgi:hypothetical protein